MQTMWKDAFTRTELLVVLAIVAISALILVFLPAVRDMREYGRIAHLQSCGRQIFIEVRMKSWDDPTRQNPDGYSVFPANGTASSTAYFNELMTRGVLKVPAAFFAAPGMRVSPGTNLLASGNLWNVTLGINVATLDGTPFLFTRNLAIDALPGATCSTPLTDDGSGLSFAKKYLLAVTKQGETLYLKGEQILTNFTTSASMTNLVARP